MYLPMRRSGPGWARSRGAILVRTLRPDFISNSGRSGVDGRMLLYTDANWYRDERGRAAGPKSYVR